MHIKRTGSYTVTTDDGKVVKFDNLDADYDCWTAAQWRRKGYQPRRNRAAVACILALHPPRQAQKRVTSVPLTRHTMLRLTH